ncbi:MAG: Ig-like domain repeat protein, partial [Thermoguttaceae bacterium]
MRIPSWTRFSSPSRSKIRRRFQKAASRQRAALLLERLEDRNLLTPVLSLNSTVALVNNEALTNIGQLIPLTGGGGASDGTVTSTTQLTFTNTGGWADANLQSTKLSASVGNLTWSADDCTWCWCMQSTGVPSPMLVTISATDNQGTTSISIQFALTINQVLLVTNTADSGSGTLRQAICDANNDGSDMAASPDLIAFDISGGQGYTAGTAYTVSSTSPGLTAVDISGGGAATIMPQSALPPINSPEIIDGCTQPGSQPNSLPLTGSTAGDNAIWTITLDGSDVSSGGLDIDGGNSTVQGLVVHNDSTGYGDIAVDSQLTGGTTIVDGQLIYETVHGNDVIAGNYVGTAEVDGVPSSTIGGTTAAGRNVISAGVSIYGFINDHDQGDYNQVEGNYIGTNGFQVLPNGGNNTQIVISGSYNVVGGTGIATRIGNVIEGGGINFPYNPARTGNIIEGNYLGLNPDGTTAPSGSSGLGLSIGGAQNGNTIVADNFIAECDGPGIHTGLYGSYQTDEIENNTIFNNCGPGIFVQTTGDDVEGNSIYDNAGPGVLVQGTGAEIESNSIFDNGDLGIDLGSNYVNGIPDGMNTNADNNQANHSGANNLMNFPVLTAASSSSTSTSVSGTFSSGTANGVPYLPNTTFTLDFYANQTPDPSGYGQGQTYLGSCLVATDANGNLLSSPDGSAVITNGGTSNASFTTQLNTPLGTGEYWVTATATDQPNAVLGTTGGNTSEFSPDLPILAPGQTFGQFLQTVLPQSTTSANSITLVAGAITTPAAVIAAVNGLTNVTEPVTVVLDLGGCTYSSGGVTVNPPANVTFVVQNGTLDPANPALTVAGGQVSVLHCTLTTSGNAPTLLVTGGNVTLLDDDIIQASTVFTDPAIAVTGGTVNLGTAASPGNNTLSVNSSGDLLSNTTGNAISAVGDTFEVGGTVETAPSLSFTGLTTSAASSIPGQPVTFTAAVAPDMPGSATPTGTVDFYDTTTSADLGKVALSGGTATLTTSALALGTHVIQASYSGDSNYLPSVAFVTQTVNTSFFVLDRTAGGAVSLSGNTRISIAGSIVVDSSSKNALSESGNAQISAASIQVVGGYSKTGNASFEPTPTTGAAYVADPLAGLAVPSAS